MFRPAYVFPVVWQPWFTHLGVRIVVYTLVNVGSSVVDVVVTRAVVLVELEVLVVVGTATGQGEGCETPPPGQAGSAPMPTSLTTPVLPFWQLPVAPAEKTASVSDS